MPSINMILTAGVAALLCTMVDANPLTKRSTLSLQDSAVPGSCTGSSACCTPGCSITIGDFHGCSGTRAFGGTCKQNSEDPDGTQDWPQDKCNDVQVTLLRHTDGRSAIDLYHKPSKTYDRYVFGDCDIPTAGGNQCVARGGGCKTVEQVLTGAQG